MRINYFHHYLRRRAQSRGARHPILLSGLLHAFATFRQRDFKNSFLTDDGEHVYCLSLDHAVFLLLSTRSQEIIKTLDAENLAATDLAHRLARHEAVSFATYVYLDAEWYALASTLRGPKNGTFLAFLNSLLSRLAGEDLAIEASAIPCATTREQAAQLSYIGRTTLELAPTNALGRHILGFLGVDATRVSSLEVTLKPHRHQNLAPDFTATIKAVDGEGLEKYVVKARSAIADPLLEYYLAASGHLHDDIAPDAESGLVRDLIAKADAARPRVEKYIGDLKHEHDYTHQPHEALAAFADAGEWLRRFPAA